MPLGHLSKPKSFIPFTLNFLKEFYRSARPEELPCCARSYAWHESRWHQLNIVVLHQLRGCYLETCFNCSFVCSECSTSNCLLPKHHFNYFRLMHHLNCLLLKHHLFSSIAPLKLLACNFITSNFLLLINHLNCLLLMHHFQLFASNAPHQLFACNIITSNCFRLMNHLNCLLLMHHFQMFASNAPHQLFACNIITYNCFRLMNHLNCLLLMHHFQLFSSNEPLKLSVSNASFPTVCF